MPLTITGPTDALIDHLDLRRYDAHIIDYRWTKFRRDYSLHVVDYRLHQAAKELSRENPPSPVK